MARFKSKSLASSQRTFRRSPYFESVEQASDFFESRTVGYSATKSGDRLDSVFLNTETWKVKSLQIEHIFSSFFADRNLFPEGSVEFDSALIRRDIRHHWRAGNPIYISLPDDFDRAQAFVDRANALRALGRTKEVIESLESAIRAEESNPRVRTTASLDLPFLIATEGVRSNFPRALELLRQSADRLLFPVEHFLWHAASA